MNPIFSKNASQNVHGWERAASIAGGLVFLAKGLGRGGLGGMLQLAIGGMALARGVTGHCEAKRVLCEASHRDTSASADTAGMDTSSVTSPVRSAASDAQLRTNAQAATGSATVTGNDSLNNPPAGL